MSRDSRPTVAFAIPKLDSGGPDRVFFDLLRALDREKYRPVLIVGEPGGRYFEQLPPDVHVDVARSDIPWRLVQRYPVVAQRAAFLRVRPDVVIATLRAISTTALAGVGLRLAFIARPANHPSMNDAEFADQGPKYRVASFLGRRVLRRASVVIAQSHDLSNDLLQRETSGLPIRVIGNPIEPARLETQAGKDMVRLDGCPKIVAIGRLTRQKGFDLLIEAFAATVRQRTCAVLTILGDGPERDRLSAQAVALGLADRVHLPGSVQNPWAYIKGADLVVSSSRYEGFPNAVLEALALGATVVATPCPGGTRDMIENGRNGWLADENDAKALATSIDRALTDPLVLSDRERVQDIERRFGIGVITRAYEAAIDDALARASSAWPRRP